MKKLYSILLTLALVLTTVSVPVVMAADAAWAFDYEFNNITSSEYSSSLTKGTNYRDTIHHHFTTPKPFSPLLTHKFSIPNSISFVVTF